MLDSWTDTSPISNSMRVFVQSTQLNFVPKFPKLHGSLNCNVTICWRVRAVMVWRLESFYASTTHKTDWTVDQNRCGTHRIGIWFDIINKMLLCRHFIKMIEDAAIRIVDVSHINNWQNSWKHPIDKFCFLLHFTRRQTLLAWFCRVENWNFSLCSNECGMWTFSMSFDHHLFHWLHIPQNTQENR